jgi:hypothetical protein
MMHILKSWPQSFLPTLSEVGNFAESILVELYLMRLHGLIWLFGAKKALTPLRREALRAWQMVGTMYVSEFGTS